MTKQEILEALKPGYVGSFDGLLVSHKSFEKLLDVCVKAIEQRDEGTRILQQVGHIMKAEHIIEEENQELRAILGER